MAHRAGRHLEHELLGVTNGSAAAAMTSLGVLAQLGAADLLLHHGDRRARGRVLLEAGQGLLVEPDQEDSRSSDSAWICHAACSSSGTLRSTTRTPGGSTGPPAGSGRRRAGRPTAPTSNHTVLVSVVEVTPQRVTSWSTISRPRPVAARLA